MGRYGKHLQGSDVKENGHALEALDFDDETREMLGLDDIEEILGQIDEEAQVDVEAMEEEAQKIKEGQDSGLDSADEMIQEMDAEIDDDSGTTDVAGGPDDTTRTSEVDKDD